jgi:hypothetical protein
MQMSSDQEYIGIIQKNQIEYEAVKREMKAYKKVVEMIAMPKGKNVSYAKRVWAAQMLCRDVLHEFLPQVKP